jgi:hypothetical protein
MMTKLRRKLFVKCRHFFLAHNSGRRHTRECNRMIKQAIYLNKLMKAKGHGTYRSVVLDGRRY